MAEEKKIWEESMEVFWTKFASTLQDATILAIFSDSYKEERLPRELFETVVVKLRERTWNFNNDPTCEEPKSVMRDACEAMGLLNCEETLGLFWDSFQSAFEDSTFIDLFCKSYGGDELLDSREFLIEFTAKLKSCNWSLKNDIACVNPKLVMIEMATNAQKKPWEHLAEAIKYFWECVESEASDDTSSVARFCQTYTEPRFPEGFLGKFENTLQVEMESETAPWILKDDPTYKKPKDIMNRLFKKAKKKMTEKARKIRKKEKREEDKVTGVDNQNMEIVQKIPEIEEPRISQEEIAHNIQKMKANKERQYAKMKDKRDERKVVCRDIREAKKRDAQTTNMANQLKGLRNHKEEEKLFGEGGDASGSH